MKSDEFSGKMLDDHIEVFCYCNFDYYRNCLLYTSGLEVLPVDCNPVEIQSVFHNPLVELAVYRHPCHHQKTGPSCRYYRYE